MTLPARTSEDADDRMLRWAALFFTVAVLLHNSDHARRGGRAVSTDLFAVGSLAILLEVGVVVLVLQRHRFAPLAAAATGFSLAIGYVVAHVLGPRGWVSDPLFSGGASRLSQAAAILEIAAALTLGAVGTVVLRRRTGLAATASEHGAARPLASALREPAAVAMIFGNAIIFAVTVATL